MFVSVLNPQISCENEGHFENELSGNLEKQTDFEMPKNKDTRDPKCKHLFHYHISNNFHNTI